MHTPGSPHPNLSSMNFADILEKSIYPPHTASSKGEATAVHLEVAPGPVISGNVDRAKPIYVDLGLAGTGREHGGGQGQREQQQDDGLHLTALNSVHTSTLSYFKVYLCFQQTNHIS